MAKTLTYSGFVISSILVILAFLTAKSYTQLAGAIILYPLLVYLALKFFPRRAWKSSKFTVHLPVSSVQKADTVKREKVDVADIDKRTFLKLIGAAGLSFFLFSLLGRRVEGLLFGNTMGPGVATTPQGSAGGEVATGALPTDRYKVTEIDDAIITFYGFTDNDGAWFIMREDTDTGSFRYSKGDAGFSRSWANRENLKYSYYHDLF